MSVNIFHRYFVVYFRLCLSLSLSHFSFPSRGEHPTWVGRAGWANANKAIAILPLLLHLLGQDNHQGFLLMNFR
jgi:hypothetical protein